MLPEVHFEVFVLSLEVQFRVKVVGFDCLQAMVFGAYDLVVQPVLCILSRKQFTPILVLFRQVAAPESLDSYDFLFKFLLVRL